MTMNFTKLEDAFRQIFGLSGVTILDKLLNSAKNGDELEKIDYARDKFLGGLLNSLPGINDKTFSVRESVVGTEFIETNRIWNLFSMNPASCGIAATLLQIYKDTLSETKSQKLNYRQLISLAIPRYFAFLNSFLLEMQEEYKKLNKIDGLTTDNFSQVLNHLGTILTSDPTKELSMGIDTVIEALMYVRERRVEESPITLDLRMGIYGSWEAIVSLSQEDGTTDLQKGLKKDLKDRITLFKKLRKKSVREFGNDLEKTAKWFGRGVAVLKLENISGDKNTIKVDRFWSDHTKAPLSMLYGLDYIMPEPDKISKNNVHLILLQNGTISFQIEYEPFLDYFAGGWRFVDLYHKAALLTKRLNMSHSDSPYENQPAIPVYRITRLAYQLAYHNHGATIEVMIGSNDSTKSKLSEAKEKLDQKMLNSFEIKYDPDLKSDDIKIGRWIYQLCTVDGITTFYIDSDDKLFIDGFGNIINVYKTKCNKEWNSFLKSIGAVNQDLGGGRHHSAYQCMLNKNKEKDKINSIVFCISQDGYIDIYMKNDWLQQR